MSFAPTQPASPVPTQAGPPDAGFAPSGQQFELRLGDQRATVVEVGGGLRGYRIGDRDVLHGYPIDAMCTGSNGAPLIPWPNRLADGAYRFDGVDYQVALNEPGKRNAIHGFLQWRSFTAIERDDARIVMGTRLLPLMGYPFALDVRVEYRLGADGLTVVTTATNIGDTACPYGSGQHPYLSPGSGLIDDCTVHMRAATRVLTDPDRQLPFGVEHVAGTAFDFTSPRALGPQAIDFAFTDLARDDDGRAWASLTGTDGATAGLWVDEAYPYLELFTGDTLGPDQRRRGLGTEPMTCPPNAFATGTGVIRLEPGDSATSTWGATLS
jgi:aldose 1-epimerase